MLRSSDKKLHLDQRLEQVIPRYIPPQFAGYGATAATSALFAITGNAAANTKGAYVEMVASTDFDCDGFFLVVTSAQAGVDMLFDIAIGAAGVEAVIVPNIYIQGSTSSQGSSSTYFPIAVAAGTRIAAAAQGSTGSAVLSLGIILVRSGGELYGSFKRATNYGANTADSGGAGIDPGGTINTEGAWAQVVASTTNPMKAMTVFIGDRANALIGSTPSLWLVDVGTGASTAEVVLINDIGLRATQTDDDATPHWFGPFPVDIPAGTRIAGRVQSNINDATDRLLDISVIGFD